MDGCSNVQEPPQKILSLADTVKLVDQMTKDLSQGCYASLQPSILRLSSNLKHHGPSLELQHTSHLDRLQLVLRPACRDQKLDLVSRVLLLEMIELRTFDWAPSQHVSNYYKMKLHQINGEMLAGDNHSLSAQGYSSHHDFQSAHGPLRHSNVKAPGFRPGTSHLLMNIPNRPAVPNHFMNIPNRPEVPNIMSIPNRPAVPNHFMNIPNRPEIPNHFMNIPNRPAAPNHPMNIPNRPAASNLFMNFPNPPVNPNLFYPDRSPPSFNPQHPPAGRRQSEDNLQVNLQNTSNCGDHSLVETGDKPVKQTKVHTKGGDLALTSDNTELLHTVKEILQEVISDEILPKSGSSSTSSLGSSNPELVYQRPELVSLASSPVCRIPPKDWDNILMEIPDIVKSSHRMLKEVPRIAKNIPIK